MTAFDKSHKKNKAVAFISKLFNSALFPALFALVCAISATGGKEVYLPCFYLLTALTVAAGLISDDLKVFVVPALMFYYSLGLDVAEDYYYSYMAIPSFAPSSLPHFAVCAVLVLAVLIYRLIRSGLPGEMLGKRGLLFWGIILFDGALLLGGIFSSTMSLRSFAWSVMIAAFLLLGYMFFTTVIANSHDGIAYTCKTLVALGYSVLLQVLIISYRLHLHDNLFYVFQNQTVLNRNMMYLTWGPSTIIAAALVLPLVGALYLMQNRRWPIFSLFSALLFWGATIFINTRSAMIVGAVALLCGVVICCIRGKNRKINRIAVLSLLCLLLVAIIVFIQNFPNSYKSIVDSILSHLRLDLDAGDINQFSSSRIPIWKDGISDFLSSPIFGVGFRYGFLTPETASENLFSNMYHCILIQILASIGIVGAFAFLWHLKQIFEVGVRRFSSSRCLLLLGPACIIAMSLVDNFFFYPNFILIYTALLACAEVSLEQRRRERINNTRTVPEGRKPRVVFTYVEAGKGHIVPTRTVCEAFRRKYGDRAEVVESKFFTETGSADLELTEQLFRRGVENQNRSHIWSFLCKLGNLLAGDTFMLVVLLRMTVSGRRANTPAVKHVEELDADVIYSAHWSVPFYVNQLKCKRPYTICFCPDVYSNGAFNVDCNRFLISSDVGYNQVAHRMRMYAGGNITQIPFPIRSEAEAYKGEDKKQLYRQKLGIGKDEFVAVLCDGGYGMAKLEKTARLLMRQSHPMTVIALCGTNRELYKKLSAAAESTPPHIRLIAVDFTDRVLEYIACADVFAGKSGANSIAEPASLGIPIIVTKCITYIEKGIKNYYVHRIRGALYLPSAHLAARRISKFAARPELMQKYRDNLKNSHRQSYDAEASADAIWDACQSVMEDSLC